MSEALFAAAQAAGFLLLAPLLRGLVKKMKAAFQLRQGPRLLQPYSDLAKLLGRQPMRPTTASWVFVAGPRVYFASAVVATTLVPTVLASAPLEGAGGILLLVAGGLAYTVGVAFYGWRRLKYHHALWHGFVMLGSAAHFFAVLLYVIPDAR